MPLIFQKRIYREDLRANPDVLYVFGDNLQRVGLGGQAGEMRGEPNAVGLATKRAPGMNEEDFFTDEDAEAVIDVEATSLAQLTFHLEDKGLVVWPLDGIGTGLSELPIRAPKLMQKYDELLAFFKKLS